MENEFMGGGKDRSRYTQELPPALQTIRHRFLKYVGKQQQQEREDEEALSGGMQYGGYN